jgi:hypothetical protein
MHRYYLVIGGRQLPGYFNSKKAARLRYNQYIAERKKSALRPQAGEFICKIKKETTAERKYRLTLEAVD